MVDRCTLKVPRDNKSQNDNIQCVQNSAPPFNLILKTNKLPLGNGIYLNQSIFWRYRKILETTDKDVFCNDESWLQKIQGVTELSETKQINASHAKRTKQFTVPVCLFVHRLS